MYIQYTSIKYNIQYIIRKTKQNKRKMKKQKKCKSFWEAVFLFSICNTIQIIVIGNCEQKINYFLLFIFYKLNNNLIIILLLMNNVI